jgi:putative redox protein
MSGTVRVRHLAGDRFEISVRQHRLEVDQPVDDGGEDSAPTPTELFVASLASCVGFYARRFLHRHGLPTDGLSVEARYEMGARPARVGGIEVTLHVPEGVPDERREALRAVASHCTVHNTLVDPPPVRIELSVPAHRAA